MATQLDSRPGTAGPTPPPPRFGLTQPGGTTAGLVAKILLLAVVLGIAVLSAFPLIETQSWIGLAIVVVVTLLLFYVYLSPKRIPAKYLVVGTLFLLAFQLLPVVLTVSTAFTNFGDGHRGSKEEAITAIEGASVQQVSGAPTYNLTIATKGDPATGELVFLLTDQDKKAFAGTADGLSELPEGSYDAGITGKITSADGYQILNIGQASARSDEIAAFSVPTDNGAIKSQGLSKAFEGAPTQKYDAGCDCIKDSATGKTYDADSSQGYFVDPSNGQNLAQGWRVNVGFDNFARVITNPTIGKYFLGILVWNFAFAFLVVGLTFALGLLVAIVLNSPRLKGQRFYRSLLILPYAMPSIAMLLVWRDMFNTDYGLVNNLFGTSIDWFGNSWTARIAVILIQLWMGYPYMFLVCTGALQSIPADLTEAASVDGAKPFYAFRTITFPLLLVATAPLLIASFAFNFNNFNAIFLTSEGGPFPADNPTAGATDLLISYTYRIAFGGQGAQYGFAAAISIFIFIIVAAVSMIGFKRTAALEDIN